jgi:hypothetical protein
MGLVAVPVQMPEPDDPGSVVPEFQVTPVKFEHGPGSPLGQLELVAPKEMRL